LGNGRARQERGRARECRKKYKRREEGRRACKERGRSGRSKKAEKITYKGRNGSRGGGRANEKNVRRITRVCRAFSSKHERRKSLSYMVFRKNERKWGRTSRRGKEKIQWKQINILLG